MDEIPIVNGTMLKNGQHRIAARLAAALLVPPILAAVLTGCVLTPSYVLPYPDTVYVPHPDNLDGDLPVDKLNEIYTTSPNRDPDGLRPLNTMERNSQMTLIVEPIVVDKERRNRIAYARTDSEQQVVMDAHKRYFQEHVLFQGTLLSVFAEGVTPDWYQPEGIYLLDDKGRKFLPLKVEVEPKQSYIPLFRGGEFGSLHIGYPVLVFSKEAISAETRAITLYFAIFQSRAAFTWVFDENYDPRRQRETRDHGKGFDRMWRNR